jgi:hypothetical protein
LLDAGRHARHGASQRRLDNAPAGSLDNRER